MSLRRPHRGSRCRPSRSAYRRDWAGLKASGERLGESSSFSSGRWPSGSTSTVSCAAPLLGVWLLAVGDDAHVPHIRNKERCPIPERPRHVDANPSLAAGDLSAAHVVVIGINYAPEPTGSAPYTTGLAETLAEVAASVTVVCGIPHYPAWRPEPAYRWRWCSAYTRNGVDVHHLRHYVPPVSYTHLRAHETDSY